jgi:pSer/pThr/pTyr-binding forkhead associated (FHA) protein
MSTDKEFFFHDLLGGEIFELIDKMIIGRNDECSISINHESISGQHLKAFIRNDSLHIMDLGSSNGTMVNGMAINSQEDIKLRSGDEVLIGKYALQYTNKSLASIQDKSFSITHQMRKDKKLPDGISLHGALDFSINMGSNYEAMDEVEDGVPGRRESEKILEKKIRTHIASLEKVMVKNNIVESRIARRITIEKAVKSMEQNHKAVLKAGVQNRDLWRKHAVEWKETHDKIDELKKEIAKQEKIKESLANVMDASDAYDKVIKERSDLLIEIKALGRERLDEKNIRYLEDIKEQKSQIRREERKIKMLQAEKKLKKVEEKKKIEREIMALQKKLKSTG